MISRKLKILINSAKHHKLKSLLLAAWVVIVSVSTGIAVCQYNNTLLNNGNWAAYQLSIPTRKVYSLIYMGLRSALVQNRLQHGDGGKQHHFLYLPKKLKATRIETTAHLPEHSWIGVIFDKTNTGMSGVIISTSPKTESTFFTANNDLLFEHTQKINIPDTLQNNPTKPFNLNVVFEAAKTLVFINNTLAGSWNYVAEHKKSPGLISGLPEFYFDNFKVYTNNSKTPFFTEDFSNTRHMFKIIGLSFVACLFLAFAALSGNKNKSRFIKIATTEFYVLTLLFSVTAAAFLYYTNYDLPQKRLRSEKDLQGKLYNYLTDKLSKQSTLSTIYSFPAKKASPTQHTPSKKPDYMVMFVGDSQTAGEGTSAPEHVFDKTAQRILSKFVKDKNIICSKMALSGGKTSKLLEQYKKLPKHNLRLCILNVRFSDFKSKQKEKLKQNLQEFIKLNAELNIKTVFMIQPINPDNDQTGLEQYTKKHITEPALQNNILVWDADKYMQSKNSTGFLWLDPMHMTSAGHKLLGAYLAHQLLLLLNNADV